MQNIIYYFLLLIVYMGTALSQNQNKYSTIDSIKAEIYKLIENENDPSKINEYYLVLDNILINQANELKISSNEEPDNYNEEPIQEMEKYTVAIIWGKKSDTAIKHIINERKRVIEDYIDNYPNGSLKYYFLDKLLPLYEKEEVNKVKEVALMLGESPLSTHKYYSYLFLASIFHEEPNYPKAIAYYDRIIKLDNDSLKNISFLLYKSDCLYNMNRFTEAVDLLKRIMYLEENIEKPVVSIIAREWIKIINQEMVNPDQIRKKFVYFQ
jgi:tetratricopeptide (TPR) repeat protein